MNVELVYRAGADEWGTLLEREAAEDSTVAFALLVERQSRFVFSVAYAVLRNVEDAEDVVQDTFFKLFRTGAWKQIRDERAFLARTAWRLAIGRAPARCQVAESEQFEIASNESNPEGAYLRLEQHRTVHRLIDSLRRNCEDLWRFPLLTR